MKFIASLFILSLSAFTQASPFSNINARDAAITKPTLTSRATNSSECWKSLSCSFTQIEESTLPDRLAYVQYLQTLFVPLNAGDEFRPFEGLINLTASADIGKPGTWASYVIAGIVEGIQRGGAIALGTGTSDAGNPGSKLWADFLTKTKNKQLDDRDVCEFLPLRANSILFRSAIYSTLFIYQLFPMVFFNHKAFDDKICIFSSKTCTNTGKPPFQEHDRLWSLAEEASTTYGLTTAKNNPAISTKSIHLNRWFTFIQVYRNIVRDRKAAGIVFRV